jgi:Fic family protein
MLVPALKTENKTPQTSARAGRYVHQPEGYRAFIPAALPPTPPVRINAEIQTALSDADRALGRLDGSIRTLPNPDLFVFMYVRKEAVLSSQIEGTQSSLDDLLEVEAALFRHNRPKDVDEVVNYVAAMNHGLGRLKTLPLSVRLIREIHEKLLKDVRGANRRPGELRGSQNWIGPHGCTLNEALYVPPPPHEVPKALSDLETFLHARDSMPALVRVGLVHAQFETIHPFLDGNGRVGRLLITFMLCEREIMTKPVLYLSHYFKHHRERYYELLQAVRDRDDWESWLFFFLTAVAKVSNEATETARKIVDLRERHRDTITQRFGRAAAGALRVLESLYHRPIISVNDIKDETKTSYTAANNLTDRFVNCGILHEITGHARNRLFRYSEYVDIFADR